MAASTKYPESKSPGDSRWSCSRSFVDGSAPRNFATPAWSWPRPPTSCPVGPCPPARPDCSVARSGGELAEPGLERGRAVVEGAEAGGELAAAGVELADAGREVGVALAELRDAALQVVRAGVELAQPDGQLAHLLGRDRRDAGGSGELGLDTPERGLDAGG